MFKWSSGCSQPCKKCSICGNWGSYLNRPCVYLRKALKAEDGKLIKLTENLNCQNYGIYALTCRLCLRDFGNIRNYVGQTKCPFRVRITKHRGVFNKFIIIEEENSEKYSLLKHLKKFHKIEYDNRNDFDKTYEVIFVSEPPAEKLDIRENHWQRKLKATINCQNMIWPTIM